MAQADAPQALPSAEPPKPPRLLEQVRGAIRRKHFSLRTEHTYIRTVQELLGHKEVTTTMIYTHVLNKGARGVRSPLDRRGWLEVSIVATSLGNPAR